MVYVNHLDGVCSLGFLFPVQLFHLKLELKGPAKKRV